MRRHVDPVQRLLLGCTASEKLLKLLGATAADVAPTETTRDTQGSTRRPHDAADRAFTCAGRSRLPLLVGHLVSRGGDLLRPHRRSPAVTPHAHAPRKSMTNSRRMLQVRTQFSFGSPATVHSPPFGAVTPIDEVSGRHAPVDRSGLSGFLRTPVSEMSSAPSGRYTSSAWRSGA